MSGSQEHIVPRRVYFLVAAALLVLLTATWAIAEIDLGPFNIVVALTIAVIKMMLVALFFMELRWSSRLTWVVAGAAIFWLLLLLGLTLADFTTRVPTTLLGG